MISQTEIFGDDFNIQQMPKIKTNEFPDVDIDFLATVRDYLKNGFTMHGDLKIEQDWLKVEKKFNDKYSKSEEFACASNMTSSVLLRTTLDDNLM